MPWFPSTSARALQIGKSPAISRISAYVKLKENEIYMIYMYIFGSDYV